MFHARCFISLWWLPFIASTSFADDAPFRYAEGKHGKGELKYIAGLPVLRLEGTPQEIGTQMGLLAAKPAARLFDFTKDYLPAPGREAVWANLVAKGKQLLPNFPPDHLRELEAAGKASGLDWDLFVAGNTMFDIKKGLGCSVLMVERERSATGGPLFGRNLDFPTLGYVQHYSLVIVCRPQGKRAFVSVGFPGVIGCLSGMNDAGLTLAVLEVASAKDGSLRFDPQGTPYALCIRRLLEECSNLKEAETALRLMKRTTCINLAICDTKQSAVFEITPKSVVVRKSVDGICLCTNHFRTPELATDRTCRRYDILDGSGKTSKLDLVDVQRKLHAANQGPKTLQTMIFEPAALKLRLAIGKCPSSVQPMKPLALAPLFLARSSTKAE